MSEKVASKSNRELAASLREIAEWINKGDALQNVEQFHKWIQQQGKWDAMGLAYWHAYLIEAAGRLDHTRFESPRPCSYYRASDDAKCSLPEGHGGEHAFK